MTTEKHLTYRGEVTAVGADQEVVYFVTRHAEARPTPIYRLDAKKTELSEIEMPCGGVAVLAAGGEVIVAGTDRCLYQAGAKAKKATALGKPLSDDIAAIAPLSDQRLAVLTGESLVVLNRKDGKVMQSLELPEAGAKMAADPTGVWLAVGGSKGSVTVFECEETGKFQKSESDRLHEGSVTALLFEPEELRFLSTGMDRKLLLTHARGKLEPEDRGRGASHSEAITAMVEAPGERFITGSRDKSLKTWARSGGARPATLTDGVVAVVDAAAVDIHDRPHLVVAGADNSLRLWLLDAGGRFGQATLRIHDAYGRAGHELQQADVGRRELALRDLASYDDIAAWDLVAAQADSDQDHRLRLLAAELLGESAHPRSAKLLEAKLQHGDEAVRMAAFQGLQKALGKDSLRPMDLAFEAKRKDIGVAAIEALQKLAAKDDLAFSRLEGALKKDPYEVRLAALLALEAVGEKNAPTADLTALQSKHADIRRVALIRLFQRKLLGQHLAQSALRRRTEDDDPSVRRTAFLIALLSRTNLAKAIRELDADIQRQLHELETFSLDEADKKTAKQKVEKPAKPTKKARKAKPKLKDEDLEPLLQAMASRAADTCLLGAQCMALLGDPRALGLLLQLSMEKKAAARVQVCRALAALEDPRAVKRLRSLLYDDEVEVRDAAFTALAELESASPLSVADAGLGAAAGDVRLRGLQLLVKLVRKDPPHKPEDACWEPMLRALNDSNEGVRGEAFKAVLNLQLGGGGADTLRMALHSVHADVRREVLTEVMAQNEPWAWTLLLELFNDPDAELRRDAFEFAIKKTKGRSLEPLSAALNSRHADLRRASAETLAKKLTKEAQALLVKALDDDDLQVRHAALGALITADAEQSLVEAMQSAHDDVRVRAATACARRGDRAALPTLVELATAEEPDQKPAKEAWKELVYAAAEGIGVLGDPAGLPHLQKLLDSPDATIRSAAGSGLPMVARPSDSDWLRETLRHQDANVKYNAAMALALFGDPLAAPLVFSEQAESVLSGRQRLAAAIGLGELGEDQTLALADSGDSSLQTAALIVLMSLESRDASGVPNRCIACLSRANPRVRLMAARALQRYDDPPAFQDSVVELFNERGGDTRWSISADTVATFIDLITAGESQTRVRTIELLDNLRVGETNLKQEDVWDHPWQVHLQRHQEEVAALAKKRPKPAKRQTLGEELQQLAFGAYIGLIREQGSARRADAQVLRVRQTAMSRILEMASQSAFKPPAMAVLMQALGDNNQAVRMQAFEQLRQLEAEPTELASEALEAGHSDLGVAALQLLTEGATKAKGEAVLRQVMCSRNDSLAVEAAKLLVERSDPTKAATDALDAVFLQMRTVAVSWLAKLYDDQAAAKKHLIGALKSKHRHVRVQAAKELAAKKDKAAFDALVELLTESVAPRETGELVAALEQLGDPRGPDVLLDRLENDPAKSAPADLILSTVGRFRRPETVERLVKLMEEKEYRKMTFTALMMISGFNQTILDPEDERPDKSWLEKQHARHDDVLARTMQVCRELSEDQLLRGVIREARWSQSNAVDELLSSLTAHSDDALRNAIVEAIGWRLKKRKGPHETLVKLLEHSDPTTRFLASEGLARAGRSNGVNVLLASIDLMSDLHMRRRAIQALGELADEQSLDILLKLAGEDAHALQEDAAEAIGHLGKSDRADKVFELLSRFAKENNALAQRAIRGLRWFDRREAWALIRQRATDPDFWYSEVAVEVLGYNDDPATRDLLIKILENVDEQPDAEMTAARRLFGDESLEPDFALLKSGSLEDHIERRWHSLERVCERGDAKQIFEVLRHCHDAHQQTLAAALLNRDPAPLEEARAALDSLNAATVSTAARILGRSGESKSAKALEKAVDKWLGEVNRIADDDASDSHERVRLSAQGVVCLVWLAWASSRCNVGAKQLVRLLESRPADTWFRPVRRAAVMAIGEITKPDKATLEALERATRDDDRELRAAAVAALVHHDGKRAASQAEALLSDRTAFTLIAEANPKEVAKVVKEASAQLHYQGVAIPLAVGAQDAKTLAAVATNEDLPEAARLSAIEGLAKMASETAEKELVKIGKTKTADEELAKAAWRGVRRSKRARVKQDV